MTDALNHIFVNFSKRKITLVDDEGYESDVKWHFNSTGAAGFAETVSDIQQIVDSDSITYCFAVK